MGRHEGEGMMEVSEVRSEVGPPWHQGWLHEARQDCGRGQVLRKQLGLWPKGNIRSWGAMWVGGVLAHRRGGIAAALMCLGQLRSRCWSSEGELGTPPSCFHPLPPPQVPQRTRPLHTRSLCEWRNPGCWPMTGSLREEPVSLRWSSSEKAWWVWEGLRSGLLTTTSTRKRGVRGVGRTQRGSSDKDKVGLTQGNAGSVSALTIWAPGQREAPEHCPHHNGGVIRPCIHPRGAQGKPLGPTVSTSNSWRSSSSLPLFSSSERDHIWRQDLHLPLPKLKWGL